jgi:hypothetical protein
MTTGFQTKLAAKLTFLSKKMRSCRAEMMRLGFLTRTRQSYPSVVTAASGQIEKLTAAASALGLEAEAATVAAEVGPAGEEFAVVVGATKVAVAVGEAVLALMLM